VESLQEAAVLADDYAVTHKPVFSHSGDGLPQTVTKSNLSTVLASGGGGGGSQTSGHNSSNLPVRRSPRFPASPTCYFCKKKGHVMSECQVLENKNLIAEPEILVTQKAINIGSSVGPSEK